MYLCAIAIGCHPSALGCSGKPGDTVDGDALIEEVSLEVSAVYPTVATIRWTTTVPTTGWVEFGRLGEVEHTTSPEVEPATEHSQLLLGLTEDTSYSFVLVVETEDDTEYSDSTTFMTGSLPVFGSDPEFTLVEPGQGAGGFLLAPIWAGGANDHLAILDDQGRYVWAQALSDGGFTRARLSTDGRTVLYNLNPAQLDDMGVLVLRSLDGEEEERIDIPGIHMDFAEVRPGLYALLSQEIIALDDGRRVLNEIILEVDDQGGERVVWDSVQSLEIDLAVSYPEGLYGPGYEVPLHLNSLSYDPVEDAFYATSLFRGAVYKVDRVSGELVWTLAAMDGDFSSAGQPEDLQFLPHSAVATAAGVLIFDRYSTSSDQCSAAAEYSLDLDRMVAERAWGYSTEDCQVNMMMGNAQDLWNGNRLLVLAMNGQIDEVAPDGSLVSRLTLDYGRTLMYCERFQSFYP